MYSTIPGCLISRMAFALKRMHISSIIRLTLKRNTLKVPGSIGVIIKREFAYSQSLNSSLKRTYSELRRSLSWNIEDEENQQPIDEANYSRTHPPGSYLCFSDHEREESQSGQCSKCKGSLERLNDIKELNVTLAGCAFLATYYQGMYEVIVDQRHIFEKIKRWGGASSGALAAAMIVCFPDSPKTGLRLACKMLEDVNATFLGVLSPSFSLKESIKEKLELFLPPNAHTLANGKLYVSVTQCAEFKNEIVSDFPTRDELIQALLCSCHIPLYCGFEPPEYKGEKYMDGFLTYNIPVYPHSGTTIFACPFSGCQHICPKDSNWWDVFFEFSGHRFKVNPQNLKRCLHAFITPSDETFKHYYDLGVHNTIAFLKLHNAYDESCSRSYETDSDTYDDYDTCDEDEMLGAVNHRHDSLGRKKSPRSSPHTGAVDVKKSGSKADLNENKIK